MMPMGHTKSIIARLGFMSFTLIVLVSCGAVEPTVTPTQEPSTATPLGSKTWDTPNPPPETATPTEVALLPSATAALPGDSPTPLPSLSGAGLIAFTSDRGDGQGDIYVMAVPDGTDADGVEQGSRNPRRLTDDPAYDGWPTWSPDGAQIAFMSDRSGNPDIYVMNADGSNVRQLTDHPANDIWPEWSPDGKRIAFPSRRDGNFEIYVINADGTNLQRLTNTSGHEDFPTWSPDGRQILFTRTEGNDGTYVMTVPDRTGAEGARPGSGDERQLLDFRVLEPAWSPDGTRTAFGSDHDGYRAIYIMDANGGNLQKLSNTRAGENCPTWSPDGTRIAFASWRDGDGEIYVVDADGGNPQRLTNNRFEDEFPAWRPGAQAATDVPALAVISVDTVDRMEHLRTLSGHSARVMTLAFSGDGVYLASSSMDETIKLWDLGSGQEVYSLTTYEVGLNHIAFSPHGRLLASADAIWDVESKQVLNTPERSRRVPGSVAFSPDGSLLAVAPVNRAIKLWGVSSGEVVRTFEEQAGADTLSIAFSPDGKRLISGEHDGTVRLWDVESGQVLRTFVHGTESHVHSVAFSPDGLLGASSGIDYTARLWDVASGQAVHILRQVGGLYDLAFSPDGTILVTAGVDVRLWDVATGRHVRSLPHTGEVMAVAFSPDGTLLASGGYDHQIYLWGVTH